LILVIQHLNDHMNAGLGDAACLDVLVMILWLVRR